MNWPLPLYPHRKKIPLPLPSANLTDFTIYVPIVDDTDIGAHCLATGYDIRFTDASGTLLSYERVSFSVTDSKASGIFWVKVPSISTAGTVIYCYYGNPSATDGSTPADAWDAGYKAVYHMNDYDASHIHDSTVNANHGTKKGAGEPAEATGKIGKGQDFDGTDDYVNCGTGATLCVGSSDFTLDSWVYPRSYSSSWRGILGAEGTGASLGINTNNGYLRLTKVGVVDAPSSNTVVPQSEWSHCVTVFDSSLTTNNLKYYLNGVLRATVTFNVDFGATVGTKYIGERTSGLGFFDGLLDEPRISSVARSADWIAYEYANQNAVDGGLVWGIEELPPTLATELLKAEKKLAVLLEVKIKKRLDTAAWTLTSGQTSTYELAGTFRHLAGVREYLISTKAKTPYALKASIAEVEAEASTYWHDEANAILYVHTSTGADPSGGLFLLKATAWRYFSNGQAFGAEALIFNGCFYDSRLSEIPDVSAALRQLSEGGIERTWGAIKILNGDGAFDAELGEWIWQMCLYVLKVGVPGGAYSDYATIARGRTGTVTWTDDDFQLACEDQMLTEDED